MWSKCTKHATFELRRLFCSVSNTTKCPRYPFCRTTSTNSEPRPRILITGGAGQLGLSQAKVLRTLYGRDNVIVTDIVKPSNAMLQSGPYKYLDVLDMRSLSRVVAEKRISWLIHFSALLSAVGEQNVPLAIKTNIHAVHNVLEVARKHNLRLFIPSTIAAFGPDTPRNEPVPNLTIQRPRTIYGVAKCHMELMGEYYFHRFGLDFRSLRFPGIISSDEPGGGTTDYTIWMFIESQKSGKYTCYLKPDTRLPMMYLDDCTRATVEFLSAPSEQLKFRTYNLAAVSFTPAELLEEIQKHEAQFSVDYKPDHRQAIADSWPEILDDCDARRDWGWKHEYNLTVLTEAMLFDIRGKLGKN